MTRSKYSLLQISQSAVRFSWFHSYNMIVCNLYITNKIPTLNSNACTDFLCCHVAHAWHRRASAGKGLHWAGRAIPAVLPEASEPWESSVASSPSSARGAEPGGTAQSMLSCLRVPGQNCLIKMLFLF